MAQHMVIDCAARAPVMVALPITASRGFGGSRELRLRGLWRLRLRGGPSAVCSAVSSAGEAPDRARSSHLARARPRERGPFFNDADRRCPISRVQPRQGAASGQDDVLRASRRIARFDDFLEVTFETKSVIGRPMGSPEFFGKAEAILGRTVQPKRPGGKPKAVEQNRQMIIMAP